MSKNEIEQDSFMIASFRPKARLMRTLGSELISSDKVALIELVKNSYDADASCVIIQFQRLSSIEESTIVVLDNGRGMDKETLEDSWFVLATNNKEKQRFTPGGRKVLGSKGIGRLAASRIGSNLLLETKTSDKPGASVSVDWRDFDENKYLDEISINWSLLNDDLDMRDILERGRFVSVNQDRDWRTGTKIQISNLSHLWSTEDIEEVRTALRRLVPPVLAGVSQNHSNCKLDFRILLEFIDCGDGFNVFEGEVQPPDISRKPHYSLQGTVTNEGRGTLTFISNFPEKREILIEVDLWGKKRNPTVGEFQFEINAWERDAQSLRQLADGELLEESWNAADIRNLISGIAGMNVYRDGFRVLPFGEKGDDWLGLDLRRVQNPSLRFSNNQISGYVFIDSEKNPGLRDQSNREGLIAGDAFEDIKSMLLKALSEMESRRKAMKGGRRKAEKIIPAYQELDLTEVIASVSALVPAESPVIKILEEKKQGVDRAVNEIVTKVSRYTRLATLGALVDHILHEGRGAVKNIKAASKNIQRRLQNSNLSSESMSSVLSQLKVVNGGAERLSSLFNQIAPFGGKPKRQIETVDIADVLLDIKNALADDLLKFDIHFGTSNVDFTVTGNRDEIYSVFYNLINNAVYWVSKTPVSAERRIVVSGMPLTTGGLQFVIKDTGLGVEDEFRDSIFLPYFSRKDNDAVGLGLAIVQHIMEDFYNGSVQLLPADGSGGASFAIIFNSREKK